MNFDAILDKAVQVVGEDKAEQIMEKVEKIMEASKDANGNVNADLDTLKEALAEVHPLLEAFMNEGGNDVIADVAKDLHAQIANIGDDLLMMADMIPMFFDKDQIKAAIDANFAKISAQITPEAIEVALQNQAQQKNPLEGMSEESMKKFIEVTDGLTPTVFTEFCKQLSGTENMTLEERVQKSKDSLVKQKQNKKDPSEQAKVVHAAIMNLPIDELLDEVEGGVEKISSDSLKTLRDEFTSRVTADDFAKFGQTAAAMALEFAENAGSGSNANAKSLGDQLTNILQSLEDAVIEAGLINEEPDLGKRIRGMFTPDAPSA